MYNTSNTPFNAPFNTPLHLFYPQKTAKALQQALTRMEARCMAAENAHNTAAEALTTAQTKVRDGELALVAAAKESVSSAAEITALGGQCAALTTEMQALTAHCEANITQALKARDEFEVSFFTLYCPPIIVHPGISHCIALGFVICG